MFLMKFKADWCGPCKMMAPILKQVSDETGIPVVEVDIDKTPAAAAEFDVQGVPTVILFDDDSNEITRLVGAKPKAQVMEHFFPES